MNEITKEMFNPCILVENDGSQYGKVMFGMSCYKNLKTHAEYKYKLCETTKGYFIGQDSKTYSVIYNQH